MLALPYSLARFLAELCQFWRSDAQLCAEVLALRHQLRVLEWWLFWQMTAGPSSPLLIDHYYLAV